MDTTLLHDVVAGRINQRWDQWAQAHPHLAAAVDRVRFVESAVAKLREDPEFMAAMQLADSDAGNLKTAVQLIDLIEKWVVRLLPI